MTQQTVESDKKSRRSGGEALVAALAAHGVEQIFGIPGTHNLGVYAYLERYGIAHFLPRHEQGAGYAADGYARSSGHVGVCLTTSGPAILNASAAASQAYSDSIPVLFISPGLPLQHPALGNGYLHQVKDQSRAMDNVVAYSHRVTSVSEIPRAVAQAFATMTHGRPRPVHLEVPLDLFDIEEDMDTVAPLVPTSCVADPELLDTAARLLTSAQTPGIIVGGGAVRSTEAIVRLAEVLGAPVLATANGKGVVPENHYLSLGAGVHLPAARAFVEDCDVLVVIGSELASADYWTGSPRRFGHKLVRIDIDPCQLVINAVPDVAIAADAETAVPGLVTRLSNTPPGPDRAEHWRDRIVGEAREEGRPYLDVLEGMSRALGPADIVAADNAMACYYGGIANLPRFQPSTYLFPIGGGTLGYGLPAAVGAKLANPNRRVMAMHGDGGFMFSATELAGAAHAGLPIPVLVIDNGGYGEIFNEQIERGDEPFAVVIPSPDFVGLARSMGCHGVEVPEGAELPARLAAALNEAFVADRPTLVLVRQIGLAEHQSTGAHAS